MRVNAFLGSLKRASERRRKFDRVPCNLAATLLVGGAQHPFTIHELSRGGAGVSTLLRLKPGAKAMLATPDGLRLACRVARIDGQRVGLLFWSEVAEADLNALLSRIAGLAAREA